MPYVIASSSVSITEYRLSTSLSEMLPHWTSRHCQSFVFCIRHQPHPLIVCVQECLEGLVKGRQQGLVRNCFPLPAGAQELHASRFQLVIVGGLYQHIVNSAVEARDSCADDGGSLVVEVARGGYPHWREEVQVPARGQDCGGKYIAGLA